MSLVVKQIHCITLENRYQMYEQTFYEQTFEYPRIMTYKNLSTLIPVNIQHEIKLLKYNNVLSSFLVQRTQADQIT